MEEILKEDVEFKLTKAFEDKAEERFNNTGIGTTKRQRKSKIRWPKAIRVMEISGKIILRLDNSALAKNMQDDESAFEGWILALRELVYPDEAFSVEFDFKHSRGCDYYKNYQRFLFRLHVFNSLFGSESDNPWFKLRSEPMVDLEYISLLKEGKIKCNVASISRKDGEESNDCGSGDMNEHQLELWLHKNAIRVFEGFDLKENKIYRQFPVGIFSDNPSKDNAIFPGKKACIDLIAEGNDESLWIFELKKKKNNPLGILSELLFYTAIVRDMAAGYITPINDIKISEACYDPNSIKGKRTINACFLAFDFHPLLTDTVIEQLNTAFNDLQIREGSSCSIHFCKAKISIDDNGTITEVKRTDVQGTMHDRIE